MIWLRQQMVGLCQRRARRLLQRAEAWLALADRLRHRIGVAR